MKKYRSISLIFTSLVLLAVFEGLWLHRLWAESYESLQQQTDYLFQQSVTVLQDTIVYQSSRRDHLLPESLQFKKQRNKIRTRGTIDSSNIISQPIQSTITLRMDANTGAGLKPDTSGELRVFVMRTAPDDSNAFLHLNRVLQSLPKQLQVPPEGHQIFKVEQNILPVSRLELNYRNQLQIAGIALDFDLVIKDSCPL